MSIHEEINHTRHDNTAHKKKKKKKTVQGRLFVAWADFVSSRDGPRHVAMERATRLEAVTRVLTLWPARRGKGI